jgi:hypothetical protein
LFSFHNFSQPTASKAASLATKQKTPPAGQRGSQIPARLTFAVLETFARPWLAVFLTLAHTRVTREKTFGF